MLKNKPDECYLASDAGKGVTGQIARFAAATISLLEMDNKEKVRV
jgi:hypothetical protein